MAGLIVKQLRLGFCRAGLINLTCLYACSSRTICLATQDCYRYYCEPPAFEPVPVVQLPTYTYISYIPPRPVM